MKRAHKRSKQRKPQVSTIKESGGKRKGKSMKRSGTEFRSGTVTRPMLDRAIETDPEARAIVNGAGRVKMLVYTRKDA